MPVPIITAHAFAFTILFEPTPEVFHKEVPVLAFITNGLPEVPEPDTVTFVPAFI